MRQTKICVIRVQKVRKSRKRTGKTSKILDENFLNGIKDRNLHVKEDKYKPNRVNSKTSILRDIITKLLKDIDGILKTATTKQFNMYNELSIRLTSHLLSQTMEARTSRMTYLKH